MLEPVKSPKTERDGDLHTAFVRKHQNWLQNIQKENKQPQRLIHNTGIESSLLHQENQLEMFQSRVSSFNPAFYQQWFCSPSRAVSVGTHYQQLLHQAESCQVVFCKFSLEPQFMAKICFKFILTPQLFPESIYYADHI